MNQAIETGERDSVTPALLARGVAKRFGPTQALTGADVELRRGEIHALSGGNGSGKSTLIKILAGIESADEGEISIYGEQFPAREITPEVARRCELHFVHQAPSTFPGLSVAENLAIGRGFPIGRTTRRINRRALKQRASEVLARFQIDAKPDDQLASLSPARQTTVAIARALQEQEEADRGILFLDEPTAALPENEVEVLMEALGRYAANGQTIVLVTHRLEEVMAFADRTTVLRDGRTEGVLDREQITRSRLAHMIVGGALDDLKSSRSHTSSSSKVLEVSNLSGGSVKKVDLAICEGEIVGVAGLMGSGRSSLLRLLFGIQQSDEGEIRLRGQLINQEGPRAAMKAGIAYLPDGREASAFNNLSVTENISVGSEEQYWQTGILRTRRERAETRKSMTEFSIKASSETALLGTLSGGNQQKAMMARCLRREPSLLLLDEPTQGVDIGARANIHKMLDAAAAEGTSILLVSSDFFEIAEVCSRAIVMTNGSVTNSIRNEELSGKNLSDAVCDLNASVVKPTEAHGKTQV